MVKKFLTSLTAWWWFTWCTGITTLWYDCRMTSEKRNSSSASHSQLLTYVQDTDHLILTQEQEGRAKVFGGEVLAVELTVVEVMKVREFPSIDEKLRSDDSFVSEWEGERIRGQDYCSNSLLPQAFRTYITYRLTFTDIRFMQKRRRGLCCCGTQRKTWVSADSLTHIIDPTDDVRRSCHTYPYDFFSFQMNGNHTFTSYLRPGEELFVMRKREPHVVPITGSAELAFSHATTYKWFDFLSLPDFFSSSLFFLSLLTPLLDDCWTRNQLLRSSISLSASSIVSLFPHCFHTECMLVYCCSFDYANLYCDLEKE